MLFFSFGWPGNVGFLLYRTIPFSYPVHLKFKTRTDR
jgi:hypothetical protein